MEMDQLVALCKRRGFLFSSSEIYGGLQGFWDYGPLGVELKRNVREAWWRDMVTAHNELEIPPGARRPTKWSASTARSSCTRRSGSSRATTICSTTTWSTCRESKKRYRYDQVYGRWLKLQGATDLRGQRRGRRRGPGLTQHKAMKFFNLRAKDVDELAWRRRHPLGRVIMADDRWRND